MAVCALWLVVIGQALPMAWAPLRFDTPVALASTRRVRCWWPICSTTPCAGGADGTVSTVVAAGGVINGPLSLATTHDGVLYVGDLDGRIVQVTPQGHQIALVGNGRLPRLARPSGLAMDADGSVLVADAAGYRLHRLRPLPVGELPAPALVGPAADAALPKTGAVGRSHRRTAGTKWSAPGRSARQLQR